MVTVRSAPGIFTTTGDGLGDGMILNADTLQPGPFDPTNGNLRLIVFSTGARNGISVSATAGGRALTVESIVQTSNMPGMDEVHVLVPSDLRGVGKVDLVLRADGRDSNPATVEFVGDARRDVLINEFLGDPPDGLAGDANRDGTRDSSQDEFIEMVNTTTHDIDISGYKLFTRGTGSDTLRHTFAAGTVLRPCSAIVVFGGGTTSFNPNDPAFGGAQVVKASTGGISLVNSGGVISLQDQAGLIVNLVSYGGTPATEGDNNQSVTRSPDITGAFAQHLAASGGTRAFSPGTQINGAAFSTCAPAVARVDVSPASATINTGAQQQFTARAFDAGNNEITGVVFSWQSNNTNVATIDQNGLATGVNGGTAEIRATGRGVQSAPASLMVNAFVPPNVVINEVDSDQAGTDTQEFVEIYDGGTGNTSLTGLVIVFYNGSDDTSYAAFDLDGFSTNANGYFTLGNAAVPGVDMVFADGLMQNGADAVAIYVGSASDFPNGTPVSTANLLDALVYDTSDADDAGLLVLLNAGQPQVNEDNGGTGISNSNQRCPNGSGGARNTSTYNQFTPTPDGANVCVATAPTLTINDVSLNEGNSGTTTFTFTVTSSLPAPANGITFDIATADGTAQDDTPPTEDNDYLAKSLTSQTITAGNTTKTFDVTVNGDTQIEANETFFVNLSNATGATISDAQGQGTIQNDDVTNLVISQVYPGGGLTNALYTNDYIEIFNCGTATVDFSVTPFSVQFLSTGASSWAKTDLTSGTLLPGHYFLIKEAGGATGAALPTPDATGTINLTSTTAGKVALVAGTTLLAGNCPGDDGSTPFNPVAGTIIDFVGYGGTAATANHCYEGSGPASFTLSNNTIAEFRKAGGCTDTNDNAADFLVAAPSPRNTSSPVNTCVAGAPPNLTINDVSVAEGNAGTTTATFTVSLSAPAPSTDLTFDIATQDNTATTANSDYVTKTLTNQVIPAGQQTYSFSVTINGDIAIEPDETFFVNVTNASGATITDGGGIGTIQNDDLPVLIINDVSQNEGNAGPTTFSFTVSLSAPAPTRGVTFDIATQDNTATLADNDYVQRTLTSQTIPAGSSTYNFDVTVNGDVNIEPNELFLVNLTNVTGATVSDGQGVGTIQNDDSPSLSINDVSQSETNAGTTTFTFTVTSSLPAPAGGITFYIATADGTAQDHNPATEDNDYVARSLTSQTITAGNTIYTFDVTVNGDKLVEPNETFFVNVSNATGATINHGQGQGTIQNDDTAVLVVSQVYGGGGNASATYANDFIEIFNRGATTIDFSVTPYSVQYAAATSNFTTNKTDLTSGILLPGHYFLVQEASGGAVGVGLPTPDASGTLAMAATAGKVALVSGTTALTTSGCPPGAPVADFLGYGTTANCSETAPIAVSGTNSNARSVIRTASCIDSDNNSADFSNPTTAPVARNSATAVNDCNGTPTLTINDVSVTEGNSGPVVANFTVSLSSPAPAGGVTFDIGTQNDSATVADNDYVAHSLTSQAITAGNTSYNFAVTVNGDTNVEPDEAFFANVTNVTGATLGDGQGVGTIQNDDSAATPGAIVISQVYGGGGNASAPLLNDFIELFNRGGTAVDVSGWSVQYVSATGIGAFSVTPICPSGPCLIQPGKYFLVKEASGGANGAAFTGDIDNGTINMSATAGRVALVNNITALSGSAACGTLLSSSIDFVGFGATAACFEGAGPTTAPSNTTAVLRAASGCTDSNVNSADFSIGAPNPRNSSVAASQCPGTIAPPETTSITDSQCEGRLLTFMALPHKGRLSLFCPKKQSDQGTTELLRLLTVRMPMV